MRRRAGALPWVAGVLLLSAWTAPSFAQCSMCKTALIQSPEGQLLGQEFNRAILLMVAAPYLVVTAILATLFRNRIRLWLKLARATSPQARLAPGPRLS